MQPMTTFSPETLDMMARFVFACTVVYLFLLDYGLTLLDGWTWWALFGAGYATAGGAFGLSVFWLNRTRIAYSRIWASRRRQCQLRILR